METETEHDVLFKSAWAKISDPGKHVCLPCVVIHQPMFFFFSILNHPPVIKGYEPSRVIHCCVNHFPVVQRVSKPCVELLLLCPAPNLFLDLAIPTAGKEEACVVEDPLLEGFLRMFIIYGVVVFLRCSKDVIHHVDKVLLTINKKMSYTNQTIPKPLLIISNIRVKICTSGGFLGPLGPFGWWRHRHLQAPSRCWAEAWAPCWPV